LNVSYLIFLFYNRTNVIELMTKLTSKSTVAKQRYTTTTNAVGWQRHTSVFSICYFLLVKWLEIITYFTLHLFHLL